MGHKDASGQSDGSVKKAALIVALLGIVIGAACLAAVLLLPDRMDAKSELVFEPLLIVASLLLLVAYCASSHLLFLPFLVINVVIIVLKILYIATAASAHATSRTVIIVLPCLIGSNALRCIILKDPAV